MATADRVHMLLCWPFTYRAPLFHPPPAVCSPHKTYIRLWNHNHGTLKCKVASKHSVPLSPMDGEQVLSNIAELRRGTCSSARSWRRHCWKPHHCYLLCPRPRRTEALSDDARLTSVWRVKSVCLSPPTQLVLHGAAVACCLFAVAYDTEDMYVITRHRHSQSTKQQNIINVDFLTSKLETKSLYVTK